MADKRTDFIKVMVTPAEKEMIQKGAEDMGLNMSQFLRLCARKLVYKDVYEPTGQIDDTLREEIRQIQTLIKERDGLFEIDRDMILNTIALGAPPVDRTLEEKITLHLTEKKLLLADLAAYTREKPEIIHEALCVLRKEGKVAQNKRMRWYLL